MVNIVQRLIRLLTEITVVVAAANAAAAWRTVALTGHSADSAGGDPLTFTQMGLATLNQQGQTALVALAQATGQLATAGIWSEAEGQGLRLLALDGRPAPGVSGGIYAGISETYPLINDAGQIAFHARLVTGGAITSTNNTGIWIADAGQTPVLVLREGDSAPGAPAGAVFEDQTAVVTQRFSVFNELGQVATQTTLRIGTGGVTGNSDAGIWRTGGGPTRVVGLEASPAPGTTMYYGNVGGSPRMNDLGQAMFLAPLKTTPSGTTSTGAGVWFGDPAAGMTLLVRDGQTAPGANGATFNVLGGFSLNNAAEYVLVANLNIGGGVTSQNDAAIWTARGGNPLALFVREADHAPGTDAADGFSTFNSLRLNSQGRIAFQATLAVIPGATDPGLTTLNDSGVWSEGGAGLQLIARENDQAPGVPAGLLFDVFSAPAMNATGRLAFVADL